MSKLFSRLRPYPRHLLHGASGRFEVGHEGGPRYDFEHAEGDVAAGKADLVAVGKAILANPDLKKRWESGVALNAPDMSTFYTPGPKGYTDYPARA